MASGSFRLAALLVLAAAGVIIWWVGFHSVQSPLPAAQQTVEAKDAPVGDPGPQRPLQQGFVRAGLKLAPTGQNADFCSHDGAKE